MRFVLPFDDKILDDMKGRTMVLAENHRNENLYKPVKEFVVDSGGDCRNRWGFSVEDGMLRLENDGSLFCGFSGLEHRGGEVYAVGYWASQEHKSGFPRLVLYEKSLLNVKECGVCVSSHVSYRTKTVEPLLKSLRKSGFDMAKVKVVVDGDPRNEGWADDREDEVKVVYSDLDAMGFAGLSEASGMKYWLLVHDTCDFERDFVEKLGRIDVGLAPDIALLMPPTERNEMGLYSSRFLEKSKVDLKDTKPSQLFGAFMNAARVVTVVGGKVERPGEKDVYGTGIKRKIISMPMVGLKKYQGGSARGGRP